MSEYRSLAWPGICSSTSVLHPVTVLLKRREGMGGQRKEGRVRLSVVAGHTHGDQTVWVGMEGGLITWR